MKKETKYRKKNPNISVFDLGGWTKEITNPDGTKSTKLTGAGIGGIATQAVGIGSGLLAGKNETGVGNVMGTLGNVASIIPGPYGAIIGGGFKVLGGLTNAAFGSSLNQEFINQKNSEIASVVSSGSEATNAQDFISDWASRKSVGNFSKSDVGTDGWFSTRAKRKYDEMKKAAEIANQAQTANFLNQAENINEMNSRELLGQLRAFGGPLDLGFMPIGGAIDYELAQKRLQIMGDKNKDKGVSPVYAFGGALSGNGADWTNGIIVVGNGGTHEQNPFEGVQMGVAPDGTPNLVEEGEVVWKDYVFSRRIKVPDKIKEKYKLKGEDLTFADAAQFMQKSSAERPNDPIARRTLNINLGNMAMEQENIRQRREDRKQERLFAQGGDIHIKPSKRGTFTAAASKHGMGVQEFASKVLANKEDYSPAMVKKANFARNASKWKHVKGGPLTALRYVPALGAAVGVATDLLGLTNKPDYSNADAILEAARTATSTAKGDVSYKPVGEYLSYNPFDRLFYANQLQSNAAATRRALLNTANGNMGAAMAGLLSLDSNVSEGLGKLYRQGEEFNLAQREKVATFNRATDMFNSEQDLKAQIANKERDFKIASILTGAAEKVAALKDTIDTRSSAAKSANLTNLFDSLGDIGREEFTRNTVMSSPFAMYYIDRDGVMHYKGTGTGNQEGHAYGGPLTFKRRRR